MRHPVRSKENSLGIKNTNYIWNQKNKQLVLIMEASQTVSKDIKALLKGNRLFLEASLVSPLNKPLRAHQLERETLDEIEGGLMIIGFSEIKLKNSYSYHVNSCEVMEPKMIKVILDFSSRRSQLHN